MMHKYKIGSKEWKLYSGKSKYKSGGVDLNSVINPNVPFQRKEYNYAGTSGFSKTINTNKETDNTMPLVIASVLAYLIFA